MPEDENGYAYMENVSKEECYGKWKGVDWAANKDNPKLGLCESDYDFDGWAAEYEEKEEENRGS